MRMRPSAPPLLFWNVRASTTCSRVTFPIFVRTRPIGRPWSWSTGGMAVCPPPLVPGAGGVVVPPAGRFVFGAPGAPGVAGLGGAAAAGRGGTLFAGTPPAVGGALAPTVGALTGVTFGFVAGMPGAAACGLGRTDGFGRCGLFPPLPAGLFGAGGVTRDIVNPRWLLIVECGLSKQRQDCESLRQSTINNPPSHLLLLARQRLHARPRRGGLLSLVIATRRCGCRGSAAAGHVLGFGDERVVHLAHHDPRPLHPVHHLAGDLTLVDRFFGADLARLEVHPQVVVQQLHAVPLARLDFRVDAEALVF